MPKLLLKSFLVIVLGTILATDPSAGVQAENGTKPVAAPTIPVEARPSPTPRPIERAVEVAPRVWNW